MKSLDRMNEYGYIRDMEPSLIAIANGKNDSVAMQSANQIKHLKSVINELVSIVNIHQNKTGNNFAWAEIGYAKEALDFENVIDENEGLKQSDMPHGTY